MVSIYKGLEHIGSIDVITVCGDYCEACGDCMGCMGEDPCGGEDGAEHFQAVQMNEFEEFLQRHGLPQAIVSVGESNNLSP